MKTSFINSGPGHALHALSAVVVWPRPRWNFCCGSSLPFGLVLICYCPFDMSRKDFFFFFFFFFFF